MKNKVLSILKSKIYVHGKNLSYFIDDIERVYDVFQSNILSSDYKNNVLVTSEKIGVDICLLAMCAINTYLEDLKNHNNYILSNLQNNQLVIYEGRKCKYINCEISNSRNYTGPEKIVLETKNGTLRIDKSEAYKISRYFGESDKLDKMEKSKDIENNRYLISKLLNQDIQELNGILNQQIIVVFESKKYMEEILSNMSIEVEGEQYEFSRVFLSRYYSDNKNYINIKGNKFNSKPIFLFTSRFDVADSILGKNEDCNKLIFLGEQAYHKSFSIIEDYTLEEEKLNKIIFHNTYDNSCTIDKLIENDVQVYALKENQSPRKNKINNILVDSIKINSLLYLTKKQLINLLNLDIDFFQKERFIRSAFKALKIYQLLCIPICELEEGYILNECIDIVKKIAENTFEYDSIYNKLANIYINLTQLYSELYNNNPKIGLLESISDRDSTIILNNRSELKFIQDNNIKYKSVDVLKNLKYADLKNEKLIFISFYDNKFINQFNIYNSNEIINILYYTEAMKYNSLARSINKNLHLIYENNKLNNKFENQYINLIKYNFNEIILKQNEKTYHKNDDANYFEEDEDSINDKHFGYEEIDEEYYYDFFNKTKYILDKKLDNDSIYDYDSYDYDMKCYKKIVFSNNQFAYLSKNYKACCIDINGRYIVKNIDSIKINDKMIFTNGKSDKDIDLMFEKIINSNVFRKQYNKDFENVNYFKNIVKDYAKKYENDYTLLSIELSHHDIEKVPSAIKQWTENRIIGPREKEVYEAMGKITMDNKLLNEWENIYNSAEVIRKFRSRFKSIFKHTIRSGMEENTDNEVIKLMIDIFDDLDDYVDIVEVEEIVDLDEVILDKQFNCLLGEKYILQGEK